MTKREILDALKDFSDDENLVLGSGDEIKESWQLAPRRVCGKTEKYTSHFCVLVPNHEGFCYCSCKHVEFHPDE